MLYYGNKGAPNAPFLYTRTHHNYCKVQVLCQLMHVSPPQAKKLVESLPQVLQKEVGKEEALRLKAVLEAAGGTVELE